MSWRDQPRWPDGTPVRPDGHGPGGGRFRGAGPSTPGIPDWAARVAGKVGRRRLMTHAEVESYLGRTDFRHFAPGTAGAQGAIEFREYSDGTRLVYKHMFDADADQVANEVETSLVAHAIGAPAPAAVADPGNPDHGLLMQYVPPAAFYDFNDQYRRAHQALQDADSADAWRLALLDGLVGNRDRHEMNVVVDEDGRLHGIDHGFAFSGSQYRGFAPDLPIVASTGARHLPLIKQIPLGGGNYEWQQVHYTATTLRELRSRVEELAPHMRARTYRGVIRILDALIDHSSGAHDLSD